MPDLPHDILLLLLEVASPSTLAAFCAVDRVLGAIATRHLYAVVSLGGARRRYESFFLSHSRRQGDDAPCRRTTELHLNGLDADEGLPDLPHIPRSLFPALRTVEVDSAARTLTAVLPILITLNPGHLVFRSPSPGILSYAFLPHLALAEYDRLGTVLIRNVDLHPPQLSDYPPAYDFPLPVLPLVRRVVWQLSSALEPGAVSRAFFSNFFNDLEGAFTDWSPAVRGLPLELRLDLGKESWVDEAKTGLEHRARGYGIAHVQWAERGLADWDTQVRGIDVRIRWTGRNQDALIQ